jgi:serine/threonine protein kinase
MGYPGVDRPSWPGLQAPFPHSFSPTPSANHNPASLAGSTSFAEGFPSQNSGPNKTSQLPFPDVPSPAQLPFPDAPSPAQPRHDDTAGLLLPGKQEKIYLDGQSLGRFQVRSRLGSSPYSEVYKIYDRLREKECALKAIQVDIVPFYMMDQSLEEITVFQQETELLGPLKHPHILPVFNWGKTYVSGANFIYKSMPLCSDGNLGSWLYRNGKHGSFSFKEIMPIVLQMADALQFAHNFQVTYQNFKLNNILVLTPTRRIQKLEVAFSDFSVVQDGSFISTAPDSLPYIAPERWDGIAHPASDQYGLAALAYELFTGRPPFQANSERTMKILHTTRLPQPPGSLNPKLPNALNAVLLRALAKNPFERFPSVQHFMQALQQC